MSESNQSTANQVAEVQAIEPIDPHARIGHIHLKVADLDRAVAFYQTVLGFQVNVRFGNYQAFLAAGSYHHHIGLRAVPGQSPPSSSEGAGLHHYGLLFPTEPALAHAVRRVRNAGVPIKDTADYGVGLAVYIDDPDGNNIELCWDRPIEQWPRRPDGSLDIRPRPLDLEKLLTET
jgi:catechol 2,3-dioxygenase